MNIHYPVPERANRSMLLLLAVALILGSLLVAYQSGNHHGMVRYDNPASVTGRQAISQPISVPEPPHSQPAQGLHLTATLVYSSSLLHPTPQPIETPPAR